MSACSKTCARALILRGTGNKFLLLWISQQCSQRFIDFVSKQIALPSYVDLCNQTQLAVVVGNKFAYLYVHAHQHKQHVKGSMLATCPTKQYNWICQYGVAEPVTCDYVCEHFEPHYTDTQPHYFSLQFPEELKRKTLQGTKLHALHAYTGLPTQLWKQLCCSIATTYLWL